VDRSGGVDHAIYKGLAINSAQTRLYATDFHNDRILVFDSKWRRVVKAGAFVDRAKSAWYAPFGIQAVGDRIFVTYAYRAPVNGNDAPTGGYVDEYDLAGRARQRLQSEHRQTSRKGR
jgi:DNA-binding beta-propeller fold protein YncE